MNTDIRISVSFKGHRKRKRLRALLGPDSTDYLLDLWLTVAMDRPEGVLSGLDNLDVSIMSGWPGDPDVFVSALLQTGFLDRSEDGVLSLHQWDQHNGYASHAGKRSESARLAASVKWDRIRAARERRSAGESCDSDAVALPSDSGGYAPSPSPSPSPLPSPTPTPTKKKNTTRPASGVLHPGFDDFWAVYPRRDVSKSLAVTAWNKAMPPLDAVLAALAWQTVGDQWTSEDGRFVPMATTYLNQRRWEGERPKNGNGGPGGSGGAGSARGGSARRPATDVTIFTDAAAIRGDFPERPDAY
jgi:hypothetical protein